MNIKTFSLKPCPVNETPMRSRAMQFVYCRQSNTLRIVYTEEKMAANGTVITCEHPSHDIRDEPEQKDQAGNIIKPATTEFTELSELIEREIMPLLEEKLEQLLQKTGKLLEE